MGLQPREPGKRPLLPWSPNLRSGTSSWRRIYRSSLTVPSVTSAPFRHSPLIDSAPLVVHRPCGPCSHPLHKNQACPESVLQPLFSIWESFDNTLGTHLLPSWLCICRWLQFFLHNRTVQLCFNGCTADPIDIDIGTLQGLLVSPVLSIIYTLSFLCMAKAWSAGHFNV
ncbi:hypothetical protein BJV74DRAFT_410000 [Russula compacta]|nr:hypothetical protein BJV74DRAFT_410000 [Russula compacta]